MEYPHNTDKITLYSTTTCPHARRVAWSLAEAGIKYENVLVDLINKPSWLFEMNPAGKIPVLRLADGTALSESLLIARYIADKYPEAKLVPDSALGIYKASLFIDKFADRTLSLASQLARTKDKASKQAKVEEIVAHLRGINTDLLESSPSGPYLLGETFSFAEVNTINFVAFLQVIFQIQSIGFDHFEGLDRFYQWKNAAMSRPAFNETTLNVDDLVKYYLSASKM